MPRAASARAMKKRVNWRSRRRMAGMSRNLCIRPEAARTASDSGSRRKLSAEMPMLVNMNATMKVEA